MEPLTSSHVQTALDALLPGTTITYFEASTATSQMAADQIGCELGQIVKSLLFIVNDNPVMVLASGDQQVDDRKIAAMYAVGRKKVKIARPEQCIEITGYPPGGVPPIAHRSDHLTVYLDESLKRFDKLYAAGGAHNAIFPVNMSDLPRLTNGLFVDVARDLT